MNIQIRYFIITLFLLISCNSKQETNTLDVKLFNKLPISDSVEVLKKIECNDEYLVGLELTYPFHLFRYRYETKDFKRFALRGSGNGEYRAISDIDIFNNELSIIDPYLSKIDILNIESLDIVESIQFDNSKGFPVSISLNNEYVCVTGFYHDNNTLMIYDRKSKEWNGKVPIDNEIDKAISIQSNHHKNQNKVEIENNDIYFSYRHRKLISKYNLVSGFHTNINNNYSLDYSVFKHEENTNAIIYTDKTIINFIDFDVYENKMATIYSGKFSNDKNSAFGNYLQLIDLTANAQKNSIYLLPYNMLSVSMNNKNVLISVFENDKYNIYSVNIDVLF